MSRFEEGQCTFAEAMEETARLNDRRLQYEAQQRKAQEKPWTKAKQTSSSSSSSDTSSESGCDEEKTNEILEDLAAAGTAAPANNSSALAEHFSNVANSSTKRGRDDISATPQKEASLSLQGQGQGQDGELEGEKEEVRTPSPLDQGVTPYWKALEERGRNNTSPKLTRSAAKKRLQSKQTTTSAVAGGVGGGGGALFFSPPDQVKNAERERREIRAKEDNRCVCI